ncbi:Aldo/keto reductase [Lizonia empirigonia]|nr:Aldo/keto reductase [Lizonia empirigonia]
MSAVSGVHTDSHFNPNPSGVLSARKLVTYRGRNRNVPAPPLCIGAWPWGDKSTFHWEDSELPPVQYCAWKHYVSRGVDFAIRGRFFEGINRNDFVIQTKFFVGPQLKDILHPASAPLKRLETSRKTLGIECVSIHLVRGPIYIQSISTIARGMTDMLRRQPELSGLLQTCKERGIIFQSYSSLSLPPKEYRFSSYEMKDVDLVVSVLRQIGERHGVEPGAVALNYNMCKGITPVVGVRKMEQLEVDRSNLEWGLTNEDIREIDGQG